MKGMEEEILRNPCVWLQSAHHFHNSCQPAFGCRYTIFFLHCITKNKIVMGKTPLKLCSVCVWLRFISTTSSELLQAVLWHGLNNLTQLNHQVSMRRVALLCDCDFQGLSVCARVCVSLFYKVQWNCDEYKCVVTMVGPCATTWGMLARIRLCVSYHKHKAQSQIFVDHNLTNNNS